MNTIFTGTECLQKEETSSLKSSIKGFFNDNAYLKKIETLPIMRPEEIRKIPAICQMTDMCTTMQMTCGEIFFGKESYCSRDNTRALRKGFSALACALQGLQMAGKARGFLDVLNECDEREGNYNDFFDLHAKKRVSDIDEIFDSLREHQVVTGKFVFEDPYCNKVEYGNIFGAIGTNTILLNDFAMSAADIRILKNLEAAWIW